MIYIKKNILHPGFANKIKGERRKRKTRREYTLIKVLYKVFKIVESESVTRPLSPLACAIVCCERVELATFRYARRDCTLEERGKEGRREGGKEEGKLRE